ncbi:MAG TPA: helix-turn-helix transcriptional regulator [Candidatus Acidoferrum sp.]|nr:helix-turn-helix transcriptional regulator [Candidatus Acidoferrum sp.]
MRRQKGRNVFDDLGFSRTEAAALQLKATLHSKIVKQAKNYSQAELQKILREPQPRVSDLLRGKIAKFSLETLIDYADALNMRPEIVTHNPASVSPSATA